MTTVLPQHKPRRRLLADLTRELDLVQCQLNLLVKADQVRLRRRRAISPLERLLSRRTERLLRRHADEVALVLREDFP